MLPNSQNYKLFENLKVIGAKMNKQTHTVYLRDIYFQQFAYVLHAQKKIIYFQKLN